MEQGSPLRLGNSSEALRGQGCLIHDDAFVGCQLSALSLLCVNIQLPP